MPKISIKVRLKSEEEDLKYELVGNLNKEKEILTYFEPTDEKTKVEYFYKESKLIRSNKALDMTYIFNLNKETEGIIYVKDLNKKLSVKIKTKELVVKENNVRLKFLVENQEFIYNIEAKEN